MQEDDELPLILPDKPWFRISEAAKILGVSKQTIYTAIVVGDLDVMGSRYFLKVSRQSLLRRFLTD